MLLLQITVETGRIRDLLSDITAQTLTQAVFILIFAYLSLIFSSKLVNWISERVARQFRIIIKQSLPIWRALILIITLVILVNLLVELSANNILTLTGTVAVALGFAFKDYMSSAIAGIVALFEAPYRVGDRIQIGEYHGEVVSYGLRAIRLQTGDHELVTLPHSKLWDEAIINTNNGKLEAQVNTEFYLEKDVDVEQVINLLYQAAYTSKYSQVKLPVNVFVEEQPDTTHFKLQSYVMDVREEGAYKTDLTKRIKQALKGD